MLKSIIAILTIAANERRMLYRTPKFWVLAAVGIGFSALMLLVTTIATLLGNNPPDQFFLEGVDGYLAIYFFSYVQAILVVFVAGDFRKAEEKARLDQVMLSRPMTTANWVLGKYFGVVSALLYLNLFLLVLAAVGRAVKVIATGVGFDLIPFLTYFIIATLPSILFMAAFVFFLVSLIRVQSVAMIVTLAYIASIWAYFQHDFYGLFDYGVFFAPLFAGDLIGLGDISGIVQQRLFFTFLGFGLLCFSIVLYPRLKQSTFSQTIVNIAGIVFLVLSALTCFAIISQNRTQIQKQQTDLAAQAYWVNTPPVQVQHYDFDIDYRQPSQALQFTVNMHLHNPYTYALDSLAFALNGDFQVSEVVLADGRALNFSQNNQLLILKLSKSPLQPHATDTITVRYSGRLHDNGETFLLDRLQDMRAMLYREDGPWIMGRIAGYTGDEYVILPAELGWYPVPGAAAGYPFEQPRSKNFATANFKIATPVDYAVISQGRRKPVLEENGARIAQFESNIPKPKFSLNIGKYQRLSRTFGIKDSTGKNDKGIEIEFFYRKNHVRDIELFSEIADTCFQVIDRILEIFEQQTGLPYPYSKLSYVEVPLQFQAFATRAGFPHSPSQPEIIMIDELRIAGLHFDQQIDRETKRARRRRQDDTPAKIKREVFIRAALGMLTDREFDYSLFSPIPNYLNFLLDIRDPLLDRALELQLYESTERTLRQVFYPDFWRIPKSQLDEVRTGGRWSSWRFDRFYQTDFDSIITMLETTPLATLRPEAHKGLFFGAVDYKASPVLQILAQTMGEENYRRALRKLVETDRFQPVTRSDFLAVMQSESKADLSSFLEQWFEEATFPGYRVTSAEAEKLDTGKMKIAYQVAARVQNGEAGDGFVQVLFHTKNDRVSKNVRLDGYEEKEVLIGLDEPPTEVEVVPYFSRNRGKVAKAVDVQNRIRRGQPIDTVYSVSSTVDSLIFYLDDRDDGFFMAAAEEAKYLRPEMKGRSWWEYNNPLGYGKYLFGWRYKRAGDGDFPARWEADVPRSGYYDLSFNLPVRNRWWARNLTRRFKMTITTADGPQPLELRFQETADGWVYMGRYRFEKDKPAVIELSDEGQGYILADAIRWEFVE